MGTFERFGYSVSQRIVWLVTFCAMRLFARFSVVGKEHLQDLPRPLLIVANHRSFWDSMIIGTLLPFFSNRYLPIGFMAADEYFKNFFFRWFFILTGTYPAHKGQGMDVSLRYPRAILAEGGVMLMFPSGKRIFSDAERESPRRGTGVLVKEFLDLSVLPIFLRTTPNVGVKDFLFGRKEMGVIVGSPMSVEAHIRGKSPEEIAAWLAEAIMALAPEKKL